MIFAVTNLAVFIFVMTAIVYETQKFRNDQITNYDDALYFTVTALTTTGLSNRQNPFFLHFHYAATLHFAVQRST